MEKISRKDLERITYVELERLTDVVRKRVALTTFASGCTPISDENIMRVVGCTISALVEISK